MARGSEEEIAQVFDTLDANLPAGWRKLSEDDLRPFSILPKPETGWYGFDTTSGRGGVVLSVDRLMNSVLKGGWVRFPGHPRWTINTPTIPVGWDEVGRFLDEAIVPAARTVGVDIKAPNVQEIFLADLPFEVRDRLKEFP